MIYYVLPDQNADRRKEGFSAIDISLPITSINVAEIQLISRYPATGFALNTQSEMIVRILEGETDFVCGEEKATLPQGSTVLVQTNRPYYWEPKGSVTLFVLSSPPWTPEQHRNIPT